MSLYRYTMVMCWGGILFEKSGCGFRLLIPQLHHFDIPK